MNQTHTVRHSLPQRALFACLVASALMGCTLPRLGRPSNALAGRPCVLQPGCTAQEVVATINQNVARIDGWRAVNARIRANNLPPLSADLAVQRDHHMRIIVSSPLGKEVDIGSNEQSVWFYARRDPQKCVHYAAHADLASAEGQQQLPFQPEWLMETLSVRPLVAEGATVQRSADGKTLHLVTRAEQPNGSAMHRMIVVDACQGIVLEHRLYDVKHAPLAVARFSQHRLVGTQGAILPYHVELDWPQAEIHLAMSMSKIEVNPAVPTASLWTMPVVSNAPPRNIIERLASNGGVQREAVIGSTLGAAAVELTEPTADRTEPLQQTASTATDFLPPVRRGTARPASGESSLGTPDGQPFAQPSTAVPAQSSIPVPAQPTTRSARSWMDEEAAGVTRLDDAPTWAPAPEETSDSTAGEPGTDSRDPFEAFDPSGMEDSGTTGGAQDVGRSQVELSPSIEPF